MRGILQKISLYWQGVIGVLVQNYSLKKKCTSVLNFDRWIYWKVAFQAAAFCRITLENVKCYISFSVLINLTYILIP